MKQTTEEDFFKILNSTDLTGRDIFYTHLIKQEFNIWYNQIGKYNNLLDINDLNFLTERRGFNEDEALKIKWLFGYMNNNFDLIRLIWKNSHIEENKLEYEQLGKLAQSETDDTVKWNPDNKVVQSHKDGTQYISVYKALEFAKEYSDSKIFEHIQSIEKEFIPVEKKL